MSITAIGTYLPVWGTERARSAGIDEDAVTMAVEAGRAALAEGARGGAPGADVRRVVLVTRELPLLEGGNGAALVAGLGLAPSTAVVEQIGGGPAVLDLVLDAPAGTLVLGVDVGGSSGASAALVGDRGLALAPVGRVQRSLPVRAGRRRRRARLRGPAPHPRARRARRARRRRNHFEGRSGRRAVGEGGRDPLRGRRAPRRDHGRERAAPRARGPRRVAHERAAPRVRAGLDDRESTWCRASRGSRASNARLARSRSSR